MASKGKIIEFELPPPNAGANACFPVELNTESRDYIEELIQAARCPKCGSSNIGFLDLGIDSPIQCRDCKEVF